MFFVMKSIHCGKHKKLGTSNENTQHVFVEKKKILCLNFYFICINGSICSKLSMSLVNISLKL